MLREMASWVGDGGGIRALHELSEKVGDYEALGASTVLNISLNEALSNLT
jgi:hypothetical protein